ncbi:MAG: IS5 family transposase [Deltaproteobacteria bacterium]|nr:MAG: IS5 family transposase [Deltaproteobacteria bacterium]
MRGADHQQQKMFSYISPESRVPKDHPLRPIKRMVQKAFDELSSDFSKMYSSTGRPSIAPEKLLKALLLQVFYSIRSERMLIEQLDYNLLFRWFVGLSVEAPVWDRSVFSKNRDRLIESEIGISLLESIKSQADEAGLLSDEHFTVDGTLIEAWASMKSFRKKDGPPSDTPSGKNPEVDFHGEKRVNETHASATDPECRLYKKSKGAEAKLCYLGHVLMENRSGLAVDARLTLATGTAERQAAEEMIEQIPGSHRITVGADKAYDVPEFVKRLRKLKATPHVAQKEKGSAIDSRTTRHAGYFVSQKIRKRVEEIFGWAKTVGVIKKTRHRGKEKVGWNFLLALSAFNLVRMRNLGVAT